MAAQTAAEDAKAYYGYLIEGDDKNKRASPVLEALLRAIAQYIVSCFFPPCLRATPPFLL